MHSISAKPRTRIAIFTNDDRVWFFPAWKAALPRLVDQYEVVGIFLFQSPSNARHPRTLRYFLSMFGLGNFLLFSAYTVRVCLERWLARLRTWKDLAAEYSLELRTAGNPNEILVARWVQEKQIDVILISVDQILKGDILAAPRVGIINKHAALLPSCRGVYPYLWARLRGLPTGITFHEVDAGIDTGRILFQQAHPVDRHQPLSMLRFYMDVYSLFSIMLPHAINALIDERFLAADPALPESYDSHPARRDVLEFEKMERIARISDLFYRPQCHRPIGERS